MPKLRLNATIPPTPWTKVPNRLLDRWMPSLTDTELRVLLALVRQTSGWNREGRPTTLSYRRLQAMTGRSSEALARALRSLRDRGLIHTQPAPALRKPKPTASESEDQQDKDK